MSSVGVVLVNWNAGEFTIPCIRSLLAGSEIPDAIVVVDNASSDGSPEAIISEFPQVIMIRNETNRGFAGANNQGIELLLRAGVAYVWLLNNDTVVAANCLEKLSMVASRHVAGAGFSAKIFHDTTPESLWYAGAYRHRWHLGVLHHMEPVLDTNVTEGGVAVTFISGCCMFVPSWAWCKYGGLIEDYVAYSEDNEWCWRVAESGGTLYYVPESLLWHKLSASMRKNTGKGINGISPRAQYLMCRNQLWTIRRHAQGLSRWLGICVNAGIAMKNAVSSGLRRDYAASQAYANGLVDGLLTSPNAEFLFDGAA